MLFFSSSEMITAKALSKSLFCSSTTAMILSMILSGFSSSAAFAAFPNKDILLSDATLTRKNSSRLFENIPRNLRRSRRGTLGSLASCMTRALKDIQLISLIMLPGFLRVIYFFISVLSSKFNAKWFRAILYFDELLLCR
ncbi:hypothetical protein D3C72_976890 [compost metagenome]